MAYHKGFEAGQNEAITLEYQRGIDDVWKAIMKIAKMPDVERGKVFGDCWISNILNNFSANEIISILDGYEPEQDEIKVGDEVCFVFAGGETIEPFIVFTIKDDNGKKYYEGIQTSDGRWVSGGLKYYKTGRHFPQVAELLKAMKGEQRDCHTCKYHVACSIECVDCYGFGKWEPKEGAECTD